MPRLPSMPSIPRPPIGPDPLRRIRVPRDLEAVTTIGDEVEPEAAGMSRDAIERIWKAAVDWYRSGIHPAIQLCVRRNGHVVIDRAIGHARGNGPADPEDAPKLAATPETPFCIFSASKAVTAMVIHMLDDRGALSIFDRVADHVPEFARHGKEEITIAHLLAHRAGIASMPRDAIDLDRLAERDYLVGIVCDAKPSSAPGKLLAYHAMSGGVILGEIVERVTGRSIRDVLADEILDPLGFRWGNYGVREPDLPAVAINYVTGPPLLPPISTLATRALSAPFDRVVELSNDPRFLTAVIPSANVVTTANELSRFFEIFRAGGELDGVRVMSTQTLRRALSEQSRLEVDFSLIFPTRFSYGLMLGADLISLIGRNTDRAFGHLGLINMMGWADPERGISGGLNTSGKALVYPELHRFYGVMQKIASEAPKLAPTALAF